MLTSNSIPDADKQVKAGLEYLKQYPIADEDVYNNVSTKADDVIKAEILAEITGVHIVNTFDAED